ncbi:MAG: nucleoside hydrolase [Bacteroidota bacterium]
MPSKFVLLFLCLSVVACRIDEREPTLPIIIDADTANEVDDLFALVRAIDEPAFDLLGITAAQFHTSPLASDKTAEESHKINEDILRLLNQQDIPAVLGSNLPLAAPDQAATSAASNFIVEKAMGMPEGETLHLVILGSCTNVASAILQEPRILPKIWVHYLGFWHDPATNSYDKKEFNSGNDTLAIEYLLNLKDLRMDVMTATTSENLVFEKSVVDQRLKGKGGIADYLVNRWETYERWWTEKDPDKTSWIMWDVAIIEALARPDLAERQPFSSPSENTPRSIGIYTKLDKAGMTADFWRHLEIVLR